MTKTAKVLWVDKRDGEGVVVDYMGNQFYFNHSSCPDSEFFNDLKDGIGVWLEETAILGDCPVVKRFG
jgi:hypothetical protein